MSSKKITIHNMNFQLRFFLIKQLNLDYKKSYDDKQSIKD